MIPNAADIVRWRITAAAVVRFVGVLTAFWFGGSLIQIIAWAIDGATARWYGYDVPSIAFSVVAFLLALSFVLLPRAWAIWLVPFRPSPACPGCRYQLRDLAGPRCPECGLELTPEFLPGTAPAPGGAQTEVATRAKARALMVPVSRLVGVLLVLIYGFGAAQDVLEVFFAGLELALDDRDGAVGMAYRFAGTGLGFTMIFAAEPFAHWLAFGRRREPSDGAEQGP